MIGGGCIHWSSSELLLSSSRSSPPAATKNVRICKYVCEEGNVSEEFRFSLLDSLSSIVGDRRTLLLGISENFRLWIMLLTKAGHDGKWFEKKLLLKKTRNNDGSMILVWPLKIFCQPFPFSSSKLATCGWYGDQRGNSADWLGLGWEQWGRERSAERKTFLELFPPNSVLWI